MLLSSSAREADTRAKSIDVLGETYVLRGHVGNSPVRGTYVEGNEANDNDLPQGFLVDQPPRSVTRPHFHETDQFQVFVGGSGRFGKKAALPLTVQYASGHTPYGPIVAGDEGIRYFTLRRRWDPGAKYMPRMRERLIRGRQRQFLLPDLPLLDTVELAALGEPRFERLFGPEDDGLMCAIVRLGPDQTWQTPDCAEGGGQYHVVVAGALAHANERLERLSSQFATPDEGRVTIRSCEQGAEMLLLRFARAS